METNETVFVTQRFDGKEIKNVYHVPVSPEIYFQLELLRRQLGFKTHSEVIGYLFSSPE
jgi:hypothetical protein